MNKNEMIIHLYSDLHIEHLKRKTVDTILDCMPGGEMAILAGDIGTIKKISQLSRFLKEVKSKYQYVVYVAGNHEFFGVSLTDGIKILREECQKLGVNYLENDLLIANDLTIWGGTGWYVDLAGNRIYKSLMPDFQAIKEFEPYVYQQNHLFREGIRKFKPDLVVSHHLPVKASIDSKFIGSPLNRFFLNDIKDLIDEVEPYACCHGHTHTKVDTYVGNTVILANPMGYSFENQIKNYGPKILKVQGRQTGA